MIVGEDQQEGVHLAARPIDMADSGPVFRHADIAGAETLAGIVAADFDLQLAGQYHAETVDDLRMPVEEAVFPAHEAKAGGGGMRLPFIQRRRKQLRKVVEPGEFAVGSFADPLEIGRLG